MPTPSTTNCDLSSHYPRDQSHLVSSGSSSTSSVSKEESRSVGGACHKQRKRKERRDSLSDEHDKKLSRSSGSIIDDLSLSLLPKTTGCNLLIKQGTGNKRKPLNNCPRIAEIRSLKSQSHSSYDEEKFLDGEIEHRKPLVFSVSVDSCEECICSQTKEANCPHCQGMARNHYHILQEQNHDHTCGGSDMKSNNLDKKSRDSQRYELGSGKSIAHPNERHSRNDSLKENTLESSEETEVTSNATHSKLLHACESKASELKSDLETSDDEGKRTPSKSVPIPGHSETKGEFEDYFHDEEGRDARVKINQLTAIEASIERHNLKNMLTYLGDETSTNMASSAEKDDGLNLYVSCFIDLSSTLCPLKCNITNKFYDYY